MKTYGTVGSFLSQYAKYRDRYCANGGFGAGIVCCFSAVGQRARTLQLADDEAIAIAIGLRTAAPAAITGIEDTSLRAFVPTMWPVTNGGETPTVTARR